jgi:Tfp pilus assembly protein FimT
MVKASTRRRVRSDRGYTLIDQLGVLAIITTVSAIAVPAIVNSVEGQRLSMETRNVERELQQARLAAVTTNSPIRVRFDCPSAGYYRRVELIGTLNVPAADDDDTRGARRCSLANYPYPAADKDPLTRPNNDGPLRQMNSSVAFYRQQTLEFWPNGTVHVNNGATPWATIGATPVTITLMKGTTTKSITVNNLGKIQIQ